MLTRPLELARLLTSRAPVAGRRVWGVLLCFAVWGACAGGADPGGDKPTVMPASAVVPKDLKPGQDRKPGVVTASPAASSQSTGTLVIVGGALRFSNAPIWKEVVR